jgi:hypothetical protein
MAPEMCDSADDTAAVDVYSFSLIVYEVIVGEPVFPATTTLPVLFRKLSQGDRPPLPGSMALTVQEIIRHGWSVDPAARGSFEGIFDAIRRIRFRMTLKVDVGKVAEFVALVDPSAAVKPAKQFPPLIKKGKYSLQRRRPRARARAAGRRAQQAPAGIDDRRGVSEARHRGNGDTRAADQAGVPARPVESGNTRSGFQRQKELRKGSAPPEPAGARRRVVRFVFVHRH